MVHASTSSEPFGLTIAEAMACGRPAIAVRAGGPAELFTHGQDACGVPPGDARALAGAVALLAKDEELRVRLGEAARGTALERLSRRRLAQQGRPTPPRDSSSGDPVDAGAKHCRGLRTHIAWFKRPPE